MAVLLETSDEGPSEDISSEAFMPKDTLDQPCDVVFVVEDGKHFKAHRQVLSKASPFFEKLLNSDMRESKEGIVRLEMFSESVMRNALEFIYTGHVQTLTEDNAQDLIVMADYLFLQNLKTVAGITLPQKLNVFNCLSTYYFSKQYQCEELFSQTRKYILANFSAVFAGSGVNMLSKEVEMWISSDDLVVSAEEDVFKFILEWIDHDKSERKKHFGELFRHVRLVYISRDFQCSDVVTNDLVRDSEECLHLVEDAMKLVDSRDFSNLSVKPRKSLETSVILVFDYQGQDEIIRSYFPDEDKWCCLGNSLNEEQGINVLLLLSELVSSRYKVYQLVESWYGMQEPPKCQLVSFNPYSNSWMSLPYKEDRYPQGLFVTKENELCALVSEPCEDHGLYLPSLHTGEEFEELCGKEKHVSFITKYEPESNSWEDISSFDRLGLRRDPCIVASGNLVYFIGGKERRPDVEDKVLTDVDRYDLSKDQWSKVADIHEAKGHLQGAAVNEKIFVIDVTTDTWQYTHSLSPQTDQWSMYDEKTNEWQSIASPNGPIRELFVVDSMLYTVCSVRQSYIKTVECYNPDKNEWNQKTEFKFIGRTDSTSACSMRIFKGFLGDHQVESFIPCLSNNSSLVTLPQETSFGSSASSTSSMSSGESSDSSCD